MYLQLILFIVMLMLQENEIEKIEEKSKYPEGQIYPAFHYKSDLRNVARSQKVLVYQSAKQTIQQPVYFRNGYGIFLKRFLRPRRHYYGRKQLDCFKFNYDDQQETSHKPLNPSRDQLPASCENGSKTAVKTQSSTNSCDKICIGNAKENSSREDIVGDSNSSICSKNQSIGKKSLLLRLPLRPVQKKANCCDPVMDFSRSIILIRSDDDLHDTSKSVRPAFSINNESIISCGSLDNGNTNELIDSNVTYDRNVHLLHFQTPSIKDLSKVMEEVKLTTRVTPHRDQGHFVNLADLFPINAENGILNENDFYGNNLRFPLLLERNSNVNLDSFNSLMDIRMLPPTLVNGFARIGRMTAHVDKKLNDLRETDPDIKYTFLNDDCFDPLSTLNNAGLKRVFHLANENKL